VLDELAKTSGHVVVRLPPYHDHYNPIELIWARIKGNVRQRNTTYNFKDVKELTREEIGLITALHWQECIQHTEAIYRADYVQDGIIEAQVDQLVNQLNGDNNAGESTTESESDVE